MTQLVVPGVQLQPHFAGSNRTLLSIVRNFQGQSQFASRPFASRSQLIAGLTPAVRPTAMSVCTSIRFISRESRPASISILELLKRTNRLRDILLRVAP